MRYNIFIKGILPFKELSELNLFQLLGALSVGLT
jgi:hypothetical protein